MLKLMENVKMISLNVIFLFKLNILELFLMINEIRADNGKHPLFWNNIIYEDSLIYIAFYKIYLVEN